MTTASIVSMWMHVDAFTVDQASALWCGADPALMGPMMIRAPSEVRAVHQMLTAAIVSGALPADTSGNAFRLIGKHSDSLVTRRDLETFARAKGLYPAFLFDTLAPFSKTERHPTRLAASRPETNMPPADMAGLEPTIPPAAKGGRPQTYDWDSFTLEIIRRADSLDGLPDVQAELIRDMLQWFRDTYDVEPAESSVKARISKIYRYLDEAKNSPS